jgi:hypothetical protein
LWRTPICTNGMRPVHPGAWPRSLTEKGLRRSASRRGLRRGLTPPRYPRSTAPDWRRSSCASS